MHKRYPLRFLAATKRIRFLAEHANVSWGSDPSTGIMATAAQTQLELDIAEAISLDMLSSDAPPLKQVSQDILVEVCGYVTFPPLDEGDLTIEIHTEDESESEGDQEEHDAADNREEVPKLGAWSWLTRPLSSHKTHNSQQHSVTWRVKGFASA